MDLAPCFIQILNWFQASAGENVLARYVIPQTKLVLYAYAPGWLQSVLFHVLIMFKYYLLLTCADT